MSSRKTQIPALRETPLSRNQLVVPSTSGTRGTPRLQSAKRALQPRTLLSRSPARLKEHYSKLDEKIALKRLRTFVKQEQPELLVQKPLTINSFVDLCRYLFSLVEGPNVPPILMSNYKAELPIRLKRYGFPLTVTGSFLKCPNTISNFKTALSIFIYLLDLIDPHLDEVKFSPSEQAYLDHFHKRITDVELYERLCEIHGCSPGDAERVVELEKRVEMKCEELEQSQKRKERAQQHSAHLQMEKREVDAQIHEMRMRRQAQEERMKAGEQSLKEMAQTKADLQRTIVEMSARLKAVEDENKRNGFTEERYNELQRQLARRQHTNQLQKERAETIRKHIADVRAQKDAQIADVERKVFEMNTKMMLSMPKHISEKLHIDEDMKSLSVEKIQQVHATAVELAQAMKSESQQRSANVVRLSNEVTELRQQNDRLQQEEKEFKAVLASKVKAYEENRIKVEALREERQRKLEQSRETGATVKLGMEKSKALRQKYKEDKEAVETKLEEMWNGVNEKIEHKKDAKLKLMQGKVDVAKKTEALMIEKMKVVDDLKKELNLTDQD